jgi:hypothetical protein
LSECFGFFSGKRTGRRSEYLGRFGSFRGKEISTVALTFSIFYCEGGLFYASGDVGDWLGTLSATLETRGKFSHLFSLDNPCPIVQGYEPMKKRLPWKWMSLKKIGWCIERRGIREALGNSILWTCGVWGACFKEFFGGKREWKK